MPSAGQNCDRGNDQAAPRKMAPACSAGGEKQSQPLIPKRRTSGDGVGLWWSWFWRRSRRRSRKKQRVTKWSDQGLCHSRGLWQCVFVAQSGQAGKILSATLSEDLPLALVFGWRMRRSPPLYCDGNNDPAIGPSLVL